MTREVTHRVHFYTGSPGQRERVDVEGLDTDALSVRTIEAVEIEEMGSIYRVVHVDGSGIERTSYPVKDAIVDIEELTD